MSVKVHDTFSKSIEKFASSLSVHNDEGLALAILKARASSLPAIQRQAFADRVWLLYHEMRRAAYEALLQRRLASI